jgi:large exoprotein involved in heme utilization and adhesion
MILSKIQDGTGTKKLAHVTNEHELLVSTGAGVPPFGISQPIIPFRQYLTSTGISTGSSDMRVNGSTTNVNFWIASTLNDIYITKASFLIADASANLNQFGTLTALTNGCQFYYTSKKTGTQYFHNALKSNFDFIRMCLMNPAYGSGVEAFRIVDAVGTSETYAPILDLTQLLPPYGLKIDAGSDQQLVLKVRDNCTGVDAFDCIVYGFERLPE